MQNILFSFLEKFQETSEKLQKGSQVINQVDKIEVGTAPKSQVWQMDKVKLFRYHRDTPPKVKTPVLISYALINRYDMMDLQADRSLIRKLLSLGLDIYVLDTGYPTRNDRYLTMNDYINVYIDQALEFIRTEHALNSINLMGICQGGTFAAIYSAIHPQKVKNLITLVTPIDFSGKDGLLFRWAEDIDADAIVEGFGGLVPGTFLDAGFQMLKPMLKVRKQTNLLKMMDDEKKLMNFLRMEKWINDLPDQAGETYRQFIKDLYQKNKLIKNELVIGEHTVNLKNINMPVLTIYASEDHLVPPSSTKPFNEAISSEDKQLYEFPGGHIGVFTGRRSQAELSPTLFEWISTRDEPSPSPKKVNTPSQKNPPKSKGPKTSKGLDFSKIGKAQAKDKNDLQAIKGIGPSLEKKLQGLGLFTYAQISKLSSQDIKLIGEATAFSPSRIEKAQWVNQAKALLKK